MTILLKKGVKILHPESTFIDSSVDASRIDASVVIHPGCRLTGADLSIGPNCVIGEETPATVDNCQLGSNVHLKGGYFSGSVFFSGVSIASSAHIRPGCVLEDQATCGHAVGLKQTIFLPFVTLGSIINFCDCIMSGGTSRTNHSEVGSSFVHFNFTPYNDKATASLFGNIPEGVMLDQPPIFLGGQAGAVGPIRLAHGCTLAAGSILRKDCIGAGNLIIETPPSSTRLPLPGAGKRNYRRIAATGLAYIANIAALREWYKAVRIPVCSKDTFEGACCNGALRCLNLIIDERITRLGDVLAGALSLKPGLEDFCKTLPRLPDSLSAIVSSNSDSRATFVATAKVSSSSSDYITFIKEMPADAKAKGTRWLQSIVDGCTSLIS